MALKKRKLNNSIRCRYDIITGKLLHRQWQIGERRVSQNMVQENNEFCTHNAADIELIGDVLVREGKLDKAEQ